VVQNTEDANGSQQRIVLTDLEWFEANPDRRHRTRQALSAERDMPCFKGVAGSVAVVVNVLWLRELRELLYVPLFVIGDVRDDLSDPPGEMASRACFAHATGYRGEGGMQDVSAHLLDYIFSYLQRRSAGLMLAGLGQKLGFDRAGANPDAAMNTLSQNMTRLLRKPSER